eukprot:SAG22_NODE_15_length_32914_cov_20.713546_6_plen_459_part_00
MQPMQADAGRCRPMQVEARVASRLGFAELARLHDARAADVATAAPGRSDASSDDAIECRMREEWRTGRENSCVRRLLAAYAAGGQWSAPAFEDAARAFTRLHPAVAAAVGPAEDGLCQSSRQLELLTQAHIRHSRAAFPVPAAATGDTGGSSMGGQGSWAGPPAAAVAAAAGSAATCSGDGSSGATGPEASIAAAKRQLLAQTDPEEGQLRLAAERYAAARIVRCARYWLRVLRPVGDKTGWQPPTMQGTRWDRAAIVIQSAQRQRLARRQVYWALKFAWLRRRRHRKRHWVSRSRPDWLCGHIAAAPVYGGMAEGGWHVAKEQHRIVREEQRERKAFETAFKAWDRKMTRMVMAKPLHEDWVPQMFASGKGGGGDSGGYGNSPSNGQPTGYYNVRTQARLPFHPHVRAVQSNRTKGWSKGQATLHSRCVLLQEYAERLRLAQAAYESRCLHQLSWLA